MLANLVIGLHMELQNVLCALLGHIQKTLEHLNVQNVPFQNQLMPRVPMMNHFVKVSFIFTSIFSSTLTSKLNIFVSADFDYIQILIYG